MVVQDIEFRTENIKFRKEKYYSPSQKQTYLAEMPAGYKGQFGPGVRAWVLAHDSDSGMSEPKILELLQTVGMSRSRGQLSDFLIHGQEQFQRESEAVVRAGLASSPWQHLDSTATRVGGRNEHCHILCNPFYTAYYTGPSKDRLSLLRVLQGGTDLVFQLNELAFNLLEQLGVAEIWRSKLTKLLPHGQNWSEDTLDHLLDKHLPRLGPKSRKLIKDSLAIVAYRSQTAWPVVELLICDDAPQFNWLTVELALCWIYEYRHEKHVDSAHPLSSRNIGLLQGKLLEVLPKALGLSAKSQSGGGSLFAV